MIDITSVIFGAAFTGVVAGFGYLVKRRISREGDREQASLMSSAADIAAKLKSNGLSYEEVEAISYLIVARKSKKKALDIKPTIINRPDSELEMADNDQGTIEDDVKLGYWTQSAMNARSFASSNRAQADLDYIIAELISVMDEEEKSIFEISQEKWDDFRSIQAEFVAYQVKGGSMEPLLRNSENESLTRQRIVSLQALFEERKR